MNNQSFIPQSYLPVQNFRQFNRLQAYHAQYHMHRQYGLYGQSNNHMEISNQQPPSYHSLNQYHQAQFYHYPGNTFNNSNNIQYHPYLCKTQYWNSPLMDHNYQIPTNMGINNIIPTDPMQNMDYPPLNFQDTYIHYTFISKMTQTHSYPQQAYPPPHSLIRYILSLLSVNPCPWSLTALSYIARNIPHFTIHFAQHELTYLLQILQTKYPPQLDYQLQYNKIKQMDSSQTSKLLQILQIICMIWNRYVESRQNQNKNKINNSGKQVIVKYMQYIVNYLTVGYCHIYQIIKQQTHKHTQQTKQQIQNIQYNIHNSTTQLFQLFCLQIIPKQHPIWHKILKLIYLSIYSHPNTSKQHIIYKQQIQTQTFSYIQIYMQMMYNNKINLKYLNQNYNKQQHKIYEYIKDKLIKCVISIGNRITFLHKNMYIQGRISQSEEVRQLFNDFHNKIFNILRFDLWNCRQKIQLTQILYGCRFICGLNQNSQGANNIIQSALQVSKDKKIQQRKTKHIKQYSHHNNNQFKFQLEDW